VLRIWFDSGDLGRVRFSIARNSETVASIQALYRAPDGGPLDRWRRAARANLPQEAAPLMALVPRQGYLPDFLTPETRGASDMDDTLEKLRRTPRARLRSDLARLSPAYAGTPWVRRLAHGRPGDLELVSRAVEAYHRACVAEFWPRLRGHLEHERGARARQIVLGGLEPVLTTLHPAIRWARDHLEVRGAAGKGDVHLRGRGLRLCPSVFWDRPAFVADDFHTPTLVYPADLSALAAGPASPQTDPLACLLGRTRAEVLRALLTGGGTTELSNVLGISPASVSEHVAALRHAGLASSRRAGRSVHHTVTEVGLSLLAAQSGPARVPSGHAGAPRRAARGPRAGAASATARP